MVTIRQVAKACGVSPMTVSFVLNNRAGAVSEETRNRVLKVVREMNYRPAALKEGTGEVLTLGLVAGVTGNSLMQPGYYNAVAVGIITTTDQLKHNITLFSDTLLHSDPHQSLRTYCDGRCDGLLVLAPGRNSALVETLLERGIPCVLIGDTGDNDAVSYVDIDNILEGKKLTEYLIRQGHRRIGFLPGPDFVRSSCQRRQGYLEAMEAQGLAPDPSVNWGFVVRAKEAAEWIQRLLERPVEERPTALFGWNDGATFHAMTLLADAGVRMPDEISLISIDDSHLARQSDPPLTSLRQPFHEIGQRAVEILIDLIRKPDSPPQRQFFPTELSVRDSVAPCNEQTS